MDRPFLAQFEATLPESVDGTDATDAPAEAAASLSSGDRTGPRGESTPPRPGSFDPDWRTVLADWDLDT